LSATPPRSYTIIAVAIVIASVLISASLLVTVVPATRTTTVTATSTLISTEYPPQAIQLRVTTNATTISADERLALTISLTNTLSQTNNILTASYWPFAGLPIFVSPPCYFSAPLEFIVLKGHFTEGNLSATGPRGLLPYICSQGVDVDHIDFQPNSDNFNMTGVYGYPGSNQSLGPYLAAINLSIAGYWDPLTSSQMQNSTFYFSFQQYFTYLATSPTPEHAFTAGVYTAAVADEWGDLSLIYFTVN
jgi:hypothetical protein